MVRSFFVGLFCLVGVAQGSPTSQPTSQPASVPVDLAVALQDALSTVTAPALDSVLPPPQPAPASLPAEVALPALEEMLQPRLPRGAGWVLYGAYAGVFVFTKGLSKNSNPRVGLDEFDFETETYTATPEAIEAYHKSLERVSLVKTSGLFALTTARQLQTQKRRTLYLSSLFWGARSLSSFWATTLCSGDFPSPPSLEVCCDVQRTVGKLELTISAITLVRAISRTLIDKPWQNEVRESRLVFGARGSDKKEQ